MEPPGQMNWVQVSALTKLPEVDEREGEEFEAKVMDRLGVPIVNVQKATNFVRF